MQFDLRKPLGVFDAGIGSYAAVQHIQRHYPQQDILYLADRASFPYGAKSRDALAASIGAAVACLARLGANAVVLASNAPSVMVLDDIAGRQAVPLIGITPPVAEAWRRSGSGVVAMLGVQSLVDSAEIHAYVAREASGRPVALVNASALVERVEDGSFLSDTAGTQAAVDEFVTRLRERLPGLDTCTLSSTHLPWLAPYFHRAAPDIVFLDPCDVLAPRLRPYVTAGHGKVVCIATASEALPLSGLRRMFSLLGVDIEPQLVFIP